MDDYDVEDFGPYMPTGEPAEDETPEEGEISQEDDDPGPLQPILTAGMFLLKIRYVFVKEVEGSMNLFKISPKKQKSREIIH